MKITSIILALLAAFSLVAGGCSSSKPKEEVVYTTPNEDVNVVVKDPEPSVHNDVYVSEKEPVPESIVRHEDGTKSVERQKYDEDKKFSEDRRVSYVMEEKDLTGKEITYYWVEVKLFDDRDKLENIRENMIAGCHARNYKITDEKYPNKKGFKLKLWSELGPISLHETIREILSDFELSIERKDEHLVVVTPR